MKHYIFTTKTAANLYDKEATEKHNFVTTQNWSTPIKHPTKAKWAVSCSPKHILEDKISQELTSDWFAEI